MDETTRPGALAASWPGRGSISPSYGSGTPRPNLRNGAAASGDGLAAGASTVPIDGIDGACPSPSPGTGLTHPSVGAVDTFFVEGVPASESSGSRRDNVTTADADGLRPPSAFYRYCLECQDLLRDSDSDYCARHADHGLTICEHCTTNVAQVTLHGYDVCAAANCLKWASA